MPKTHDGLMAAIDRWVDEGLVAPDLGERLRDDVSRTMERQRVRWSQYILAGTGAIVLLTAAGVFLGWAWPVMEASARVAVLILLALTVQGLGVRLENRDRWVPASYLMQTAGLVILLVAVGYSEEAWPDATPGAIVMGVIALTVPLITAWTSVRRDPIMPAVHAALGYAFLGLFLSRAVGLSMDEIVWILDGVVLASIAVLFLRLRRDADGDPHGEWALNAFAASLYAALVLVFLTAVGPLDMSDRAVLPLDVWWTVVVALTLWAVHRAPPTLQRTWYEAQLGWSVVLGTGLAFATGSVLDFSDPAIAGFVAVFGAAWLAYGLPRRSRPVITAGCLALVAAAWYLGVEEGGALGAVLALAFTGGLLFWVSARVGSGNESEGAVGD